MNRTALIVILLGLFARNAISAAPHTEELAVTSAVHSVVYGEVVNVRETREFPWSEPGWRVKLNVKCTLTGPYDAVAHPFLAAVQKQLPRFPKRRTGRF